MEISKLIEELDEIRKQGAENVRFLVSVTEHGWVVAETAKVVRRQESEGPGTPEAIIEVDVSKEWPRRIN